MRRRLIQTNAAAVHTWLSGVGGVPLLLLHMSPRSGRMYHPVMELLDRPVAAPDRPGFGFSDAFAEPPTIEQYAATTCEVVDELGWAEFDVIGTHTGSVEAIELARVLGDRVRRVGLAAIPAYTSQEIETRLRGVAAPRPRPTLDGSHLIEMWHRRALIRSPEVDPAYLQTLFVDEALSMEGAHSAYRAVLAYPTLDRLSALQQPVVVFAPHDDLRTQTQRALPHLPAGSTVVPLPHLDFDLWSKAPEELADLVATHFPLEQRSDIC